MSFTAEVKDELSRVESRRKCCPRAELSALVRVEGTLHYSGNERFRLEIATETAPVARKVIKLLHGLYDLSTELTVRRSVLHKSNNYLITAPNQPRLAEALADLGILDPEHAPVHGIPAWLVKRDCCAISYLRGAFLGGGFVADPHGDFHFELTAENEQIAEDLTSLMGRFDMSARVTQRRGTYAVYLKGAEPIVTFLALVGAHRALLRTEDVRIIKGMRNDVNRLVNAETANLQKSADAAMAQIEAIRRLADSRGLDNLPPALRELAELRLENPDASLRELGELAEPPLSKSAVYHRIRRLEELASR
ncbi:MAG: DNA-binding protein WhiA [Coriobacteriia bacterium]